MSSVGNGREGGCTPFTRYLLVILAVCLIGTLGAVSADRLTDAPKSVRSDFEVTAVDSSVPAELRARYQATNAPSRLRAYFGDTGVHLMPLDPEQATWGGVDLTLGGYSYVGQFAPLMSPDMTVEGSRLQYRYADPLTVSFENTDHGLVQQLTLSGPPIGKAKSNTHPLQLSFILAGDLLDRAVITDDKSAIYLQSAQGTGSLKIAIESATGSNGETMAVHFNPQSGANGDTTGLTLVVDNATVQSFPMNLQVAIGEENPKEGMELSKVTPKALFMQATSPIHSHPEVAPANDQCAGAELIPAAGPFPYLTAVTADITDATTIGDPPGPTCAFANTPLVKRSIWYRFTPAVTATYIVSACADAPTGSTVDDTVVAVYTSSTAACGGTYTQTGCDDDTCATEALQSVVTQSMTAGTTYFIVANQWGGGTEPPAAGSTAIQLRVSQVVPPANDTCGGATPLTLNIPANGTNALATNDYQLTGIAGGCYSGIGQTTSSAVGRDTVWSYTPSLTGSYSFRAALRSATGGGNLVLYTQTTCPTAPPTQTITCNGTFPAANRTTSTAQFAGVEEIMCVTLTANTTYFLFVDESTVTTTGGDYVVEVNPCVREVEPNDLPATANTYACGIEGTRSPAANLDFFSLGTPGSGSRVFAMADGIASNNNDYRLRVTDTTNTLEFDDDDNTTPWGSLSPNISGRGVLGAPAFLEMDHFSATVVTEPYRLYSVTQPGGGGLGGSSATPETEPNNGTTLLQVNQSANNFFSGTITASGTELDVFAFAANAGDLIVAQIDADPLRDNTPINPAIFMFDQTGAQLLGFTDANASSTNTPSPGVGLTATTPNSPGEAVTWRARYSGVYYAAINTQSAVAGDYLYSIAINCLRGDELSADLSATKTGPATGVPNSDLTYTIVINNNGPNAATGVSFSDTLPPGTSLVSLSGPASWVCTLSSGVITCTNQALGSNIPQTFTLVVHVPYCFGTGPATNTVTVSSLTSDPVVANNTAVAITAITDPGTCDDGSFCTAGDTCVGTVCQGGPPPPCDDGNACTSNVCNPTTGQCENAPIVCNDNNACTDDTCDPLTGCVFTADDTNTCTDNSACTDNDHCSAGTCVTTPVVCNDNNDCTDDTCNPATGCVFTNDNTNTCTDGNACTADACVNGTCVSGPRAVTGSAGPITVPDGTGTVSAPAVPYPSTITIPAGDGNVLGVEVTINGLTHTFPDDLDMLLVGPSGANAVIWSDAGGGTDVSNLVITLADTAATALSDVGPLANGTFKPANYETDNPFPPGAPAPAGGSALSVFTGTNPTGAWSLYIDDDLGGDTGTIASWSLRIFVDCDDHNPCTIDTCNPASGCVHTPVVCDDGNACTTDSCDPSTGTCVATPISCDDGNPCTIDGCDPLTGCYHNPVNCDDSNICTDDACDPSTGQCTHTPVNCNDNNACTNDACIQALVTPPCVVPDNGGGTVTLPPAGCEYLSPQDVHEIINGLPGGTTIELGAIHRDFICHVPGGGSQGVCSFPNLVDCDEAGGDLGGEKECSDSSLQLTLHGTGTLNGWDRTIQLPISFETHTGPRTPGAPVQSFPTEMFRLFGQITNPGSGDPDFDLLRIVAGNDFGMPSPGHTTLRDIGGGNWSVDSFFDITYRIDFVGAPGGHVGGMSGSTTGTIRMQTGAGVGCVHTPVDCNDNNACTTDTCDPATGCLYAPVDCNDNNPCTDDACDPATGCTHTPHSCDDGNACTADTCDPASGCVSTPITCDDNNACTDDTCNPATGCVYTPDNTNLCTDNNTCTVDTCINGQCVSTGTVCDDGNPCTDDTCDATGGCIYTPDDTNTCSDGNACTAPDTCQGGQCGCHNSSVCSGTVNTFENTTAQTIPGGPAVVTSTISVSGVGSYLYRLRLPSFVLHSNNADLDITLTSPAGTVVTITSDNGGTNDNVFNGTVWDDKADPANQVPFPGATTFAASNMATDTVYTNNVAKTTLTPEEPLGAFVGENPNGVWTLRVSDDTAANSGTLSKWSLETTTLGQAPLTATSTVSNTTPVTIPDNSTVSSSVAVSGAGTQIGRIRITTAIRHTFIGDLDITLTSPGGRIVTIVSDAGTGSSGNDNVYNGTTWDDKADPGNQVPFPSDTFAASNLITDTVTTNLVVRPTLVPEEPLAAFIGDDPNGTWTLRIADDATGDTGALTSWSIEITTNSCANPCTVVCNDNNPCTDDSCDPATGCVYTPNNNNTCSDGNTCTTDACVGGTCVGTLISCDDGDVCTDDTCVPGTGCVHNPNNAPCDDGNACTTNDHCSTGTCTPLFTQNFDGVTAPALPAGWTAAGSGAPVDYATTTAFADTIPNSAATDDPTIVSDRTLDSPPVAITSAAAQITFRNRYNLENSTVTPGLGYDGAVLEIKIGAGAFTDIVAAGGSFVTGGYNHTISTGFSSPIGGRAAWSGNSAGFVTTTANLPASANGQSVIFRFRRASDSSLAAAAPAGHWVDTISVTQPCPNICRGGGVTDCNDNNACTTDTCDPITGCQHAPVVCNDGNPCTDDTCDPATGCVYTPHNCDDGNACTIDACDPTSGQCTHAPITCNDNNPCTDDTCNPASGCVYTPNTNPCDDGSLCTTNDRCTNGSCVGQTINCSDGNACTTDGCDPLGGCTHTTIDCNDHNKCTNDSCNPTTGCVNAPIVCNDGNACTTDTCDPAGGCVATTIDCNDHNKCTNDSCNPTTGCVNAPIVCNDGNACTTDTCDPVGGCVTTAINCNDNNACTNDSCNPASGCVNTAVSCDDGNACTTDTCDAVQGCTHTTVNCNDHNKCTNDSCNPATGCVTSPVNCDDGNACTADTCDPASGCAHNAITCNDNNPCTNDSCNPTTGCVYTPNNAACDDANACTLGDACSGGSCQPGSAANCDDANPCTTDSCNPASGCNHAPNPGAACNDGNACTTGDACNTAGQCAGGAATVCNDNNPCTADSCNPSTGCVSTPTPGAPCDDANACTTGDACNAAGQCASGTPLACNDNNPCTADTCNPSSGCVSTPTPGAACSDGNACTSNDACNAAGQCAGGAPLNCDDGNQCTTDGCSPASGCTHSPVPSGTACNDGNVCTTTDTCNAAGQCVGSGGPNCDDGNPCTTDTCVAPSGCTHAPAPSGTACSDGNACTAGDTCNASGSCQGGGAVNCDDGNQCTTDSCNPSSGCTHASTPGAPCNDGNPCTTGDACTAAGTCQGGGGVNCDDGNPCTVDSCGSGGCTHAPAAGAACNDGNACTTGDTCNASGSCQGGSPLNCDDHNACTNDGCNPASGCTHSGGGDSDGDGIVDCEDACPHSISSSVVIIDGCNTGVPNYQTNGVTICGFNNHCNHQNESDYLYDEWGHRTCGNPRTIGGHGCNVADLIQICRQIANCPQKWADCVEKVTKELKNQHILTEKQRNKIRKCVQRAIHGGRNPHSHSHTRHQNENHP